MVYSLNKITQSNNFLKLSVDLFKTKSINELKEYMDQHYKDWAKKYNLENPRTTLDENMIRLAHNKH